MGYANCIDVSIYQGDINFKKVKSDGIDYVIIRAITKNLSTDKNFETNYKNALSAGLKIGVYVYAYATTTSYAKKEAQAVVDLLKGRTLHFPVFYDLEGAELGAVSKDTKTSIMKTFAEVVEQAGYTPGIYCNEYWYKSKLDTNALSKYPYWVAKYGANDGVPHTKPDVKHTLVGWQFSSKGNVSGISGNVDMNQWYIKPSAIGGGITTSKSFSGYVTANALNIRKGPGTNYDIIGVLKKYAVVKITSMNRKWGYVKELGGWVSTKYIGKAIGNITITCHSLTMRSEPSISGQVKGYAKHGEKYSVFVKVKSGSKYWYLLSNGAYCSAGDAYSNFVEAK